MCVDFTDLNKACPKDDFPLPKIDRLVDSTAGHAIFSFMDANAGYHQIPMKQKDQPHTAFVTSQGVYCYKVMPFGLKNAGATYQRLVNKIFEGQIGRNIEVYVDDMIVKSKKTVDHVVDLKETLSTLRKYGMKLNPKKCVFGVRGGKCLGFMVDERGIEANPDKIQAIIDMESPRSVKEVQRLTGCMAALGRFLSRSADKSLLFFRVLKRNSFKWDDEAEQAFRTLKDYLTGMPKLVSPLPGETLFIYLAISEYALSAVLVAEREKNQHPVYFISHAFRGAEARYTMIEKLVYALVMASRKLKPYFQAHPIKVLTGQPIRKIIEGRNHSNRMTEWANQLSDYGLEYEPRRAIKAQALADFIVECTNRPPMSESGKWELFTDGSSTKTGGGAGMVIKTDNGDRLEYAVKFNFPASNNEAEYEALILGVQMCVAAGASKVIAKSDSQLVVGQVKGEFEAKEDSMKMYLQKFLSLTGKLDSFEIHHIPRSENHQADALSRLASSAEGEEARTINWQVLKEPSINEQVTNMVLDRGSTWMDGIVRYLKHDELPIDEKEADRVKKMIKWFRMHDDVLYKLSYTHPLLKCITPEEGDTVLREIHEGTCGSHQGARAIAGKALRSGYYWPTLKQDSVELVKRCPECQFHSDIPKRPSNELTTVQTVLPFDRWGLDLIGPFPPATGQRKFLIVGVDYFTKWIEAEPLAKITDKHIQEFIWKNIIVRFGVPRTLISDNGRQFDSSRTREYCARFGIQTRFTSVARPQSNGQAEAANKIILQGLKKKLNAAKGSWVDELPGVLWSARTTVKEATGHTPFSLTYGSEAVLPVEVDVPSPRVTFYDYDKNKDMKTIELDLLPEARGDALLKSITYKQKMARFFNRRVLPRQLSVGDWVLRKIEATGQATGKLGAKWDGPYRIESMIRPGTYKLIDQEGHPLPRPWHTDNLKKFYV